MLFSEVLTETSGPTATQNKPATQAKRPARIMNSEHPVQEHCTVVYMHFLKHRCSVVKKIQTKISQKIRDRGRTSA